MFFGPVSFSSQCITKDPTTMSWLEWTRASRLPASGLPAEFLRSWCFNTDQPRPWIKRPPTGKRLAATALGFFVYPCLINPPSSQLLPFLKILPVSAAENAMQKQEAPTDELSAFLWKRYLTRSDQSSLIAPVLEGTRIPSYGRRKPAVWSVVTSKVWCCAVRNW
ncbi:hypothetical protein VTI74DRAFT_7496 [Chaetomium olivicolor]